jgi:transposase
MSDARKIPDEVMNYIRRLAVDAVLEQDYSPSDVAKLFHINRSTLYDWLNAYRQNGDQALDTRKAPGKPPVITQEIERWLKRTVLHATPVDYGYDTELWTLKILADLLKQQHDIDVYESTVFNHLHRIGLSCQAPCYRAYSYDPDEVEFYLNTKWPKIQRLAHKLGADIFFEDEAGVGIMTRSGRTWGAVNSPPIVSASDQRGGYNVLSAITRDAPIMYASVVDHTIDSDAYIAFLEQVRGSHPRPIVLVVDRVSFHRSKKVREYVRAHRDQIRVFFLPRHAPQYNPSEQVWNDVKHHQLGRQPIIDKKDLKKRLVAALQRIAGDAKKIGSFFRLPDTRYVLSN